VRLAWRNLSHDRLRFAVTIAGVAFAVFLMVFQGSLLSGFVRASSSVIDATDADLWITARGVPCFDFPAPLPSRFRELSMNVTGVNSVERIAAGITSWQKPSGVWQTIIIVGADPAVGSAFPLPYLNAKTDLVSPETVLVDNSALEALGLTSMPGDVEIGRRRAQVAGGVSGFGSFIGSPYVFTGYNDAVRYLHYSSEETTFLLVHVAPGNSVQVVQQHLRARLPEADIWTRAEFARRARLYWVIKTGAGGALLTAALLGAIVGTVIVSQTIYAMTMESLEEFATLKAMGASRWYIRRVVLIQALVSSVVGCAIGLAVTFPSIGVVRGSIPWVYTPWWLAAGMILVSLLMCSLASTVSIRKAIYVEPGRVFRA
jgi:putative ABC transport system permease protein